MPPLPTRKDAPPLHHPGCRDSRERRGSRWGEMSSLALPGHRQALGRMRSTPPGSGSGAPSRHSRRRSTASVGRIELPASVHEKPATHLASHLHQVQVRGDPPLPGAFLRSTMARLRTPHRCRSRRACAPRALREVAPEMLNRLIRPQRPARARAPPRAASRRRAVSLPGSRRARAGASAEVAPRVRRGVGLE